MATAFARVYVLKSNQRRFSLKFLQAISSRVAKSMESYERRKAKKNERAPACVAWITRYVIIFACAKSSKIENQSALGQTTRDRCDSRENYATRQRAKAKNKWT